MWDTSGELPLVSSLKLDSGVCGNTTSRGVGGISGVRASGVHIKRENAMLGSAGRPCRPPLFIFSARICKSVSRPSMLDQKSLKEGAQDPEMAVELPVPPVLPAPPCDARAEVGVRRPVLPAAFRRPCFSTGPGTARPPQPSASNPPEGGVAVPGPCWSAVTSSAGASRLADPYRLPCRPADDGRCLPVEDSLNRCCLRMGTIGMPGRIGVF
mmetsp:Transcript_50772/g.89296  ORF Transcript_50772/g.89296 Transcript_50772/m.89296 type:complete len:212 (+) Transcript_50772:74-709(+)